MREAVAERQLAPWSSDSSTAAAATAEHSQMLDIDTIQAALMDAAAVQPPSPEPQRAQHSGQHRRSKGIRIVNGRKVFPDDADADADDKEAEAAPLVDNPRKESSSVDYVIDSRDTDNVRVVGPSTFEVSFPFPQADLVRVVSACVPRNTVNINRGNNCIVVRTGSGNGAKHEVRVPPQVYPRIEDICASLACELSAAVQAYVSVEVQSEDQRVRISAASRPDHALEQFTIDFTDPASTLGRVLGFPDRVYESALSYTGVHRHVFRDTLDMYVLLQVPELGSRYADKKTLVKIDIGDGSARTQSYRAGDSEQVCARVPEPGERLTVRFRRHNNEPYHMDPDTPWSLHLRVTSHGDTVS